MNWSVSDSKAPPIAGAGQSMPASWPSREARRHQTLAAQGESGMVPRRVSMPVRQRDTDGRKGTSHRAVRGGAGHTSLLIGGLSGVQRAGPSRRADRKPLCDSYPFGRYHGRVNVAMAMVWVMQRGSGSSEQFPSSLPEYDPAGWDQLVATAGTLPAERREWMRSDLAALQEPGGLMAAVIGRRVRYPDDPGEPAGCSFIGTS